MDAEKKLAELGLELPPIPTPVANYVPVVRVGSLLFLSGHGPGLLKDGQVQVMLNLLQTLKQELGDLDRVKRVVKLLGFVNCAEDFQQQPQVINGASDLLVELYGERGRHARSAVGMYQLPFNIAVEIEMIVEA